MHTTTNRRTRTRIAVGLAVAAIFIAGCGNSDDADSTAAPGTTAPSTSEAAATTAAEAASTTSAAATTAPDEAETTAPTDTTTVAPDEPDLGEFAPIEGVPGVTDEQIGFGIVGTGPANPLGYCLLECYTQGVEAYFEYRNELGGVNGRQLAVTQVLDDEFGNNQVRTLELINSDDVFGVFSAPVQYAGFPDLASAGVPTYTTFPASPETDGAMNIYVPSGTLCIDCPRRLDVEAARLAGATKVAALGFGVSQASKDCVANKKAVFEQFGPEVGIEFVYANDLLEFGLPNGVAPEVTAMTDAGVDFILNCIDQNSALLIEQELERQGAGEITMGMPQGYGDTEFISTNAALLEGDLLATQFRPLEADPAGTIMTTMQQYMDGLDLVNDYTVQGWIGADLAVRGILAAGPQFDRASVVSATNEITDWTAGGLVPPVDWSRQHVAPTVEDSVTNGPVQECMAYLRVTGGKLEVTGTAEEPFTCFPQPANTWVEPTLMTFS